MLDNTTSFITAFFPQYLNLASRSPLPTSVTAVGTQTLARKVRPWLGMGTAGEADEVRELFASLINCTANEVAMMPSTAYAMSFAAANVVRTGAVKQDEEVMVLQDQVRACAQTHTRRER